MVYAVFTPETKRWAILANQDDEEVLFHLEPDGTIWYMGHGNRGMSKANGRAVRLTGLEESADH